MGGKVVPLSGFDRFSGTEGAGEGSDLTGRQRRWLDVVASGGSLGDAAKAANVSERTGRRWRQRPEMGAALHARQGELMAIARAVLVSGAAKCARRLVGMGAGEIAGDSASLAAARAVLDAASSWSELADLAARLDALEAQGHHEDG